MKTITKGIHMDITPAIQDYLDKRLQGIEKFLDDNAIVEAELGRTTNHHRSGEIFKAQLNVMVHGDFVRAESEQEDLYAAIDVARDELHNILSSRKDKRMTIWKKGALKIKNLIRGGSDK